MSCFYKSYYWEKGLPCGVEPVESPSEQEISIKIVKDPYRKHISIEEYLGGLFNLIIYDSKFLDFRHLKLTDQTAWQKEKLNESTSIIRNGDDRVIHREVYKFEDHLCRECQIFSPHGILLATQKMYYKKLLDDKNCVILFDARDKPVMCKTYSTDDSGNFMDLLEENWKPQRGT